MARVSSAFDLAQVSDPATPVAGRQFVYVKTDGAIYVKRPDASVGQVDMLDMAQTFTAKKTFNVAPQIGDPASGASHASLGNRGALLSIAGGSWFSHNCYYDGTVWRAVSASEGSAVYGLTQGYIAGYTAPAVAAGAPVTFTAMFSGSPTDLTIPGTVKPGGLPGAKAASRYAGATASGAPTTGTWAVGDLVVAQDGKIWICTVAGTPGTWADAGAGAAASSGGGTAARSFFFGA